MSRLLFLFICYNPFLFLPLWATIIQRLGLITQPNLLGWMSDFNFIGIPLRVYAGVYGVTKAWVGFCFWLYTKWDG